MVAEREKNNEENLCIMCALASNRVSCVAKYFCTYTDAGAGREYNGAECTLYKYQEYFVVKSHVFEYDNIDENNIENNKLKFVLKKNSGGIHCLFRLQ